MTGFKIVNLKKLIEIIGEEAAKAVLSDFSCPKNKDVEQYIRNI